MQIEITSFFYSNWQNIIITLIISTLFYILSNYAFKKYITSGERIRIKQAKASLLDILEARIINKQDISLDKIENLLEAIEREHSIYLYDVTPFSILQDLDLQFEKSHHLDPSQKEEYCRQIQNKIQEIITTEEELILPRKYSEIFEILAKEIKSQNTVEAMENLELLKKKITEREEYLGEEEVTITSWIMKIISFVIVIYITYSIIKFLNLDLFSIILVLTGIIIGIIVISIVVAFLFGLRNEMKE